MCGVATCATLVDMRQVINYSEAEQLLRAGVSQREVAERFGVTPSAISVAINRGLIKHDSGRRHRLPWDVKSEHLRLSVPNRLRTMLREDDGLDIPLPAKLKADSFRRGLEASGTVIHYDPDRAPYFFRVPRRPGVDEGYFRNPEV